jgi:hypothetical protein
VNLPFRQHTPDEGFEKRTISMKILSPAHRHLTKNKTEKNIKEKQNSSPKLMPRFHDVAGKLEKKHSAAENLRGGKEKNYEKNSRHFVSVCQYFGDLRFAVSF